RGVVEPERRPPPDPPQDDHAGFDGDAVIRNIDVENAVQPRQHDQDAVGMRQRAARQPRTGSSSNEWHAVLVTAPDDSLHLRCVFGQHHETRSRAQLGEAVGFEGDQLVRIAHDPVAPDDAFQFLSERAIYHATIAPSNNAASSSGPAGRGDSFVTRCCGRGPSTSAGMSADEEPLARRPFGTWSRRMNQVMRAASTFPASSARTRDTSTPSASAAWRWRSGLAGAVKRNT